MNSKYAALEARIEELEAEKSDMQATFLREVAELREQRDNYQKWYHEASDIKEKILAGYRKVIAEVVREIALNIVMEMTHAERNKSLRSVVKQLVSFRVWDIPQDMDEIPF